MVDQDLDRLVLKDVDLGELRNVVDEGSLSISDSLKLLFEVQEVLRVTVFNLRLSFGRGSSLAFGLVLALAAREHSKGTLIKNIQNIQPIEVHKPILDLIYCGMAVLVVREVLGTDDAG